MASSSPAAYLFSLSAQTLSLSSLSRRPYLSSHAHLSLSSRRLIIANGSTKNGRRSNGGANNNGRRSGGGRNNNNGRGGGGGGGGGDGRKDHSIQIPTYLHQDANLIEYFDKHHVDISRCCIIALVYLFGFVGIFEVFLHLTGFYDYYEKVKNKGIREEANMKGNESYGKAI